MFILKTDTDAFVACPRGRRLHDEYPEATMVRTVAVAERIAQMALDAHATISTVTVYQDYGLESQAALTAISRSR